MQIINTSQRECDSLKPPVAFSTEREVTQRRGPASLVRLPGLRPFLGRRAASCLGAFTRVVLLSGTTPLRIPWVPTPSPPRPSFSRFLLRAEGGYRVLRQAPGPRQTVRGRCPSSRIVPTSCVKGPNNRFLFSLPPALGDKSMV